MAQNKLYTDSMNGDFTAMAVYADYLEENNGGKALIYGLRFCSKYKKFPKTNMYSMAWWWESGSKNKIYNNKHRLPLYLESITIKDYFSIKTAIEAIGKFIMEVSQTFNEII